MSLDSIDLLSFLATCLNDPLSRLHIMMCSLHSMRSLHLLVALLGAVGLVAAPAATAAAPPTACDASRVYSILQGVPTATKFCSSLLYPRRVPTKTTTATLTPSTSCVEETRTRVVHTVETTT